MPPAQASRASASRSIDVDSARHVAGLHLNLLPLRRDPAMVANPTPEEARYLEELALFLKEDADHAQTA